MFFSSHITWDKLKIEIELLKSSSPSSLLPLIFGIENYIFKTHNLECTWNSLKRMSYELHKRIENLSCDERIQIFNDYFFQELGFQPRLDSPHQNQLESWLPSLVSENKNGSPLIIGLLYQYLGYEIDLPFQIVSHPHFIVLKWMRPGKTSLFLDITRDGQTLSNQEILQSLNKYSKNQKKKNLVPVFDFLNHTQLFTHYLEGLFSHVDEIATPEEQTSFLDILIMHCPENPKFWLKRALIKRKVGQFEETYKDLQQYFRLTDKDNVDSSIQSLYFEVQSQLNFMKSKPSSSSDLTLLH